MKKVLGNLPLYVREGKKLSMHSHGSNIQTKLKHLREGELYGIVRTKCNTKEIELWENHKAESSIKAILQFSKQKQWSIEKRETDQGDLRLNPTWPTMNCVILVIPFVSLGHCFLVNWEIKLNQVFLEFIRGAMNTNGKRDLYFSKITKIHSTGSNYKHVW